MTPPLSTYVPSHSAPGPTTEEGQKEHMEQRPPLTPPLAALSSPPPTVGGPVMSATEHDHNSTYRLPMARGVDEASPAELRTLLQESFLEVDRLKALLRDAQTSAAHFKLQYKLLSIESEETAMRMAVEQEMTRREVEFLRSAEQKQKQHAQQRECSKSQGQSNEYNTQMSLAPEVKQYCQMLQSENDLLKRRLRRAKRVILRRDGEIASLTEESDRLRSRIRENRELFNRLLRPGRSHENSTSRNIDALVTTPGRMLHTRIGNSVAAELGRTPTGGEDTFAALLLADQVLSQENASAPTTPIRRRPPPRQVHARHHRGSQSLSSLPPVRRPQELPTLLETGLLPPAQLAGPELRAVNVSIQGNKSNRRHSRDSTISASEGESSTPPARRRSSPKADIIQESQASQLARQILRRSPEMRRDGGSKVASKSQSMSQSKLSGQVRKPGIDHKSDDVLGKRKSIEEARGTERRGSADDRRQSKRSKTAEVVGLGIKTWGSSPRK